MAEHLCGRLGGHDPVPGQLCPDEEDVEQRPGHAGQQVERGDQETTEQRLGRLGGVELEDAPGQPSQAWNQAQQQVEQRLGGRIRQQGHDQSGRSGAQGVEAHDPPLDVAPVQEGAPAICRHLDQPVGDQGRGDWEHERQGAHQHQAASHAEHARDGGRDQGCDKDEDRGGKAHPTPTSASSGRRSAPGVRPGRRS